MWFSPIAPRNGVLSPRLDFRPLFAFRLYPVIPAKRLSPHCSGRGRESTTVASPEFSANHPHPRHSREGGNPRLSQTPKPPPTTFTPVIPAKAGIHDRRKPRILRQPPPPPSFPRRRESTTVANLEPSANNPNPRHSREGGNPRLS